MSSWAHGYNVEQGYTYGAYRELSPEWLDFAARYRGFTPPNRGKQFRYLELGSGQGLGLCILAACYPEAEFVGVDFNPGHTAHARGLAEQAGLGNVRFLEADFHELAQHWPSDLGQFHYAVLHGIYTWVPVAVRHAIVQCLKHATLPGALVHNSYNAMPGWASAIPTQHILRRLQVTTAGAGTKVMENGVSLLLEFEKAGAAVFKALPGMKPRLEKCKTQNRAYLVQEYLHDHWQPMWFSQVATEMAAGKLEFVASASMIENEFPALMQEAQRKVIAQVEDPVLQQELIDCAINQGFRRDIFGRGVTPGFQRQPLLPAKLLLPKPFAEKVSVTTSAGEFNLKETLVKELGDLLASGPKTMSELLALPSAAAGGVASLRRSVAALLHGGNLCLARDQAPVRAAQKLNECIAQRVTTQNAPYTHLAAAASGSCIGAGNVDMLLLDVRRRLPKADVAAYVAELERVMARIGRQFMEQGKPVTDPAAQLALRQKTVEAFVKTTLPSWIAQGVVA